MVTDATERHGSGPRGRDLSALQLHHEPVRDAIVCANATASSFGLLNVSGAR